MTNQNIKGTALVTGASSGIGATYADRLVKRGYDLILVARDIGRLEVLAARLKQETGVKVEPLQADLTNKTDVARVEERLRADESINVLINNAGMGTAPQIVGADLDKVESMIQLNVVALTRLAGAVAPGFVARGSGVIINIGSVVALMPESFSGTYSGTKAYVLNFSQALHEELSKSGIQIQAVLPGMTRTEIWERSGTDASTLPPEMVMGVDEMVDAALAGLDLGELITIPSLPDMADWEAFTAARLKLAPNLSLDQAAGRYKN